MHDHSTFLIFRKSSLFFVSIEHGKTQTHLFLRVGSCRYMFDQCGLTYMKEYTIFHGGGAEERKRRLHDREFLNLNAVSVLQEL